MFLLVFSCGVFLSCLAARSDRDTTLFARREFEQEVFYYKRAPVTTPGTATPSSTKGQALYPRDMVGLEEAAKDAFPDLSLTML